MLSAGKGEKERNNSRGKRIKKHSSQHGTQGQTFGGTSCQIFLDEFSINWWHNFGRVWDRKRAETIK